MCDLDVRINDPMKNLQYCVMKLTRKCCLRNGVCSLLVLKDAKPNFASKIVK